jgi:hypothetical protein
MTWGSKPIHRERFTIDHIEIASPCLPKSFEGYTVAQISDLHFGPHITLTHIRNVVNAILNLKPDLIVITGDFVTRTSHGELDWIGRELSSLNARDGVLAVLGNHDWWNDPDRVSEAVNRAGMKVLRNEHVKVTRQSESIYVAGVDDVWECEDDLPRACGGIPVEAAIILLAHEPDYADTAAHDPRIILQMSGHSHGGQVRMPIINTILTPYLGRYKIGLRRVKGLWLYTNRGIGVMFPPIRFNCPSEITLFTLRSE